MMEQPSVEPSRKRTFKHPCGRLRTPLKDPDGQAIGVTKIGSALGLALMTAIATAQGADQIGNPSGLVDRFR
jgi:hypothetical protein